MENLCLSIIGLSLYKRGYSALNSTGKYTDLGKGQGLETILPVRLWSICDSIWVTQIRACVFFLSDLVFIMPLRLTSALDLADDNC